jgi:hypothetical protein
MGSLACYNGSDLLRQISSAMMDVKNKITIKLLLQFSFMLKRYFDSMLRKTLLILVRTALRSV